MCTSGLAVSDRRVSHGQATRVHCHGHGHGPEPQSDPRPAGADPGVQARPGRTTLHRWIKSAGIAAGRVLKHLDARCQALVLVGCLDEIFFHRRPVLVGVEPTSMVWFLGQKANDRTGSTWSRALQDFSSLSYVLADAGTGLQAGIAAVQQQRQQDVKPPLENRLDVFYTTQEAQAPVLRRSRAAWNGSWSRPKRPIARSRMQQQLGHDPPGAAVAARSAWKKTATAFQQYERSEAGWKIAHAAMQMFRPEGRLNERPSAKGEIARALPQLSVASGPRSGTTSRRRRR